MRYYHIDTATIHDDHSSFINKITRCGEPWKLDLTQYGFVPVVYAPLAEGQKHGEPVLEATRYYYPAIAKSAGEIAAETTANKKALIAAIARAAQDAVESEANAALQDQMWANYKSATPHLYVVENVNWGKSIYSAAENRKAQVEAGVADDYATLCDFSSFGPKPYTVYQLYMAGVVEL